jgi:hypothetical protein
MLGETYECDTYTQQHRLALAALTLVAGCSWRSEPPRAASPAQSGDKVRLIVIPAVGHFETASPHAKTWARVESVIRTLLEGRMPVD